MDQQGVKCEKCGMVNNLPGPPMPPQIVNGINVSCGILINAHFKCGGCGTEYVSQITGFQLSVNFVEVPQQNRIIVPNMVPPKLA